MLMTLLVSARQQWDSAMSQSEQAHDRARLLKLQGNDAAQLIATYRKVAHMQVDETLPPDVSFISMIDAIIEGDLRDKLAVAGH